jgi:hypothetical protein
VALCVLTLVGCGGYALHAATGPRGLAGEQSSFVGAILAPTLACQRAIAAADTGEGTVAVHAIHQAYLRFPELPSYEQLRLAEVSRIVAVKLEHQSLHDEAKIIWAYAELLFRRVDRPADEAQTKAKLYAPAPSERRR